MIENISIKLIKKNRNNPRVIKDIKFKRLVKSIAKFPEMLKLRPIMVDDDYMVLGGNMRLRACKELKMSMIPIVIYTREMHKESDLCIIENMSYEDACDELVIKDNASFGEWDWDALSNKWETSSLTEWGVDVWQNMDDVIQSINDGDEHSEWVDMPEFESQETPYKIIITFISEEVRLKYVKDKDIQLSVNKEGSRTWGGNYPEKEQEDLKSLSYE